MNDVVVADNFQTRLERKIQESIGELMTAEDVHRLVEAGINKALFEKRVLAGTNFSSYSRERETKELPCLVDELVGKHFEPLMRAAVTVWLKEHPAVFDEVIKTALADSGREMVMRSIAAFFTVPMSAGLEALKIDLRAKGIFVN